MSQIPQDKAIDSSLAFLSEGYTFIGTRSRGGDVMTSHRCPGEQMTVELMKTAVRFLTTRLRYHVPEQDLNIDLHRMPAVPESRFIISSVEPVGRLAEQRGAGAG